MHAFRSSLDKAHPRDLKAGVLGRDESNLLSLWLRSAPGRAVPRLVVLCLARR
jgi:hypothetical protein